MTKEDLDPRMFRKTFLSAQRAYAESTAVAWLLFWDQKMLVLPVSMKTVVEFDEQDHEPIVPLEGSYPIRLFAKKVDGRLYVYLQESDGDQICWSRENFIRCWNGTPILCVHRRPDKALHDCFAWNMVEFQHGDKSELRPLP